MKKLKNLYKISLISIALVLLLVSSIASAVTVEGVSPTITETKITNSNGTAYDPAIYEDRIVWRMELRNGNNDIYMYDLSTQNVTQITTSGSASSPAIYGDRIVWVDNRNIWKYDIYMYDLSTQKETQITTNGSAEYPAIYGDKIVWEDHHNSYGNNDIDIYMYDISTKKETQITNSGSARYPAIYGDKIVWEDRNNENIYMYDLSTSKETQITTNERASSPTIYGDRIVYSSTRNGNTDVYMYDLSTKKETQITTNEPAFYPTIYGDRIVWFEYSNGWKNWNIYMYDLSTQKETQITNSGSAEYPAIYGDKIVWPEYRSGNWDIYMCTISNVEPDPGLPAASFSASPTSGSAPLKVLFNDSSKNAVSFNWDFGDGTYSTEKDPAHIYSTAGIYTVNLTVSNENGTNSKLATINVLPIITKTLINTSKSTQNPTIYGDKVVWEIVRSSSDGSFSDIYVYDLSTMKGNQITTSGSAGNPAIYGNRIVWRDWHNGYQYDPGNSDIYMYDLSTSKETQITTSGCVSSYTSPAIYGDKILWEEDRNRSSGDWASGIYMYDISTKKETQIPNSGFAAYSPTFYGDRIVWVGLRYGNMDIYMYDLSTSRETQITTNGQASDPAIYGDRIVWLESKNGKQDIYMYDLSTQKDTQITTSGSASSPAIYGDKIGWIDERNGNSDIYMYDLSISKETQITSSGSVQSFSIYSDKIVWKDSRNENIYICTISSREPDPGLPVASFSASPTTGNAPLKVQFNDRSENVVSLNWDFGDGTYSTEKDPIHTYSTAGIYTVNLTVSNENGIVSKLATINVLPTITETQITNSGSALNPTIYGDKIVWEDRNSDWNWNIYMYDISTKKETQITNSESYKRNPAIYGDRIVWEDYHNGRENWDIHMYDLTISKETQIPTSNELWESAENPAIYGDKIVWACWFEDFSDIYMYDLSTSKETHIAGGRARNHAIYGDNIVWTNFAVYDRGYDYDIYAYNISTNTQTRITTNESAFYPAIYEDRIVWVDWRNGVDNIYMYDLSTSKETQITNSESYKQNPAIYGNRIVWEDDRNGRENWDIHMYDLTTKKETQITTSGSAYNPAIYGDRIVWEESRNGYSDIYMCTISSGETEPKLPVANFSASPTSGNAPLKVLFNDSSENADSFNWDFGDGTYSTEKDPIHTYSTAGIYTVNLTVSNENGAASKLTTINVSTQSVLPVFPGCTNPPIDLKKDGLYEDINGNGIMDFDDVVSYYENMDWIEENVSIAFFDYNKNGLIDFDDVVKLYDML